MVDAWQILRDGGLPLSAPRRAERPTPAQLREAATAAIATDPSGRGAEALAAFLFAWHHHWPGAFDGAFGADGDRTLAWAAGHRVDRDRYLKLRRIAIENLAGVL